MHSVSLPQKGLNIIPEKSRVLIFFRILFFWRLDKAFFVVIVQSVVSVIVVVSVVVFVIVVVVVVIALFFFSQCSSGRLEAQSLSLSSS